MILPCGSMSTLKGIPLNPKVDTASLCQNLRSLTCVQSRWSARIASCQAPFSLSRDTPRIAKFFPLNSWYAFTTLGFSARQGPHQLAQKSTSRYLPRKEEIEMDLPLASGSVRSGACLPTQLF